MPSENVNRSDHSRIMAKFSAGKLLLHNKWNAECSQGDDCPSEIYACIMKIWQKHGASAIIATYLPPALTMCGFIKMTVPHERHLFLHS